MYCSCAQARNSILPAIQFQLVLFIVSIRGTTYPCRAKGTSWDTPIRNQFTPQIYNTQGMTVALAPGYSRNRCEVLLGGRWQDYAICVTIPRSEAKKIAGKEYSDIKDLWMELKQFKPYLIVPQGFMQYLTLLRDGEVAKYLHEWWGILSVENRQLLCFLFSVVHNRPFQEPTPEHDISLLESLNKMMIQIDSLMVRYPSLMEHLKLLQSTMALTNTQLTSQGAFYCAVSNFLMTQLRELISHDIDYYRGDEPIKITNDLYILKLLHEVLIAESTFWQCANHCDKFHFQTPELMAMKMEIQRSYDGTNPFSIEVLLTKREKITSFTQATKEKLHEFLDRKYILNSGYHLLTDVRFIQARGRSNIYCLGEWYRVWVERLSNEIQFLTSNELHQQAIFCEKLKESLILLQSLYDKYATPQSHDRFVTLFDHEVIKTIFEVKTALEQGVTLDVGRYLYQRVDKLVCLMGTQAGHRNNSIYSNPVNEHLERLNEVEKPKSNVSPHMDEDNSESKSSLFI